ncbi:MAG: hypothetical protein KJ905_03690 [Nanoarchaeota archaeon]|nr:hypothetical protein [Nanoarchaeota archaeon]MBU1501843.1 hypothetical protein [Nanoarchaeota archaeon]
MEALNIEKISKDFVALKKQMEDIEFAIRTEMGLREIESGKCKTMSSEEFFESLRNDKD